MTAVPPPSESSRLRASDEDRDRALDVLRAAAGDGRLTAGEFGERMEAALSARTLGDLAALTADLTAPQARDVTRIAPRGGSVRQAGRWLVPRRLEPRSSWSDVTLDFTDAVITHDTLRVEMNMRGGTLLLLIGPGVVVDTGALTVRYTDVQTAPDPGPAAPVTLRIELTGRMKYGQIQTRRPGD